jgi:hypothetical protein
MHTSRRDGILFCLALSLGSGVSPGVAAAIRTMLKHEQTAITAIEEALAALGETSL